MNIRIYTACAASVFLAACAGIPSDRGREVSEALLKTHSTAASLVPADQPQNLSKELLDRPLDADACVRLALLGNPLIKSLYADLGLAQAEVYDAARLSNPSLGYVELSAGGSVVKTTWSLSQRFTELLFLRFQTRMARSELLQAQQSLAEKVLELEAEVRGAYYRYVGASLIEQMRARVSESAAASAQYAGQLYDAGNISELQLSREQAAASAANLQQRKAQVETVRARGELFKLLGLSSDRQVDLIDRLPLPVAQKNDTDVLQTWALQQRLDLVATREALRSAEANVQHTRHWRWFGGFELGAEREREQRRNATGPSAGLELPLFNPGGGAVLRSQAQLESLQARMAALELSIRNDVVVQAEALRAAADMIEEYRQRLVPLQTRIVELAQQQQNFMLIGAFELLAAKQQELDTYQAYLESVRDYWQVRTEFAKVLGGRFPDAPPAAGASVGIDAQIAPGASQPAMQMHNESAEPAQSGEHHHE